MFTLNCASNKTCPRELMKKGNNTKSKSKFQIFLNLKGTNIFLLLIPYLREHHQSCSLFQSSNGVCLILPTQT